MSYAVIKTGGKQYKVKSGEILKIEKLPDSKADAKIEFKEVLAYGDDKTVEVGLPVIQGNAETELHQFPNQSFDYVVLSQTHQAFYEPEKVLRDLMRIGKSVIISIPNFGYWKVRTKLLFFGIMPVTKTLPNTWYNTPNFHMCTIKDLFNFCDEKKINIKKAVGVNEDKTSIIKRTNLEIKNLFSKLGIFLIG